MARVRVQRNRAQMAHVPAPIMGMDTVSAGVTMPPGYSIYSYNLIGGEYGLRSRLGWREWVIGLDGEQVRSLLPFTGSTSGGSNNRLFACTESGIWDVSSSGAAVGSIITSTTYIPGTGSLAANTYYFAVTAMFDTTESMPSAEASEVVAAPNGEVEVTWDPVAGATGYRLYMGTVS